MQDYSWVDPRSSRRIEPSPEQFAFFDWTVNGSGSLVLEAVAGAGKSTTLARALGLMEGTVAAIQFNTRVAKEAEEKAKQMGYYRFEK